MSKSKPSPDGQPVKFEVFGVGFSGPLGLGVVVLLVVVASGLWWFWPRIVPAPAPTSVALEITSSTLVKQKEQEVCSKVGPWSRNCHNKADGEAGCPDVQELLVTATTELGHLRNPRIVCVTDNDRSCEWNFGSHFKRATWQWTKEPSQLKYTTPISSKSIRIKVCATEEVRKSVPSDPVVVRRWEHLTYGSTFSARVPAESSGVLIVQWPSGELRLPVGQSYSSLVLLGRYEMPGGYTEYSYVVQSRGGRKID